MKVVSALACWTKDPFAATSSWSNHLTFRMTPTPISPRRYQPPQHSSTGACTRGGGIIGGARGARSAANASGIMTNAAAPASTKLFTLPIASSFLQQGTPGDGPLQYEWSGRWRKIVKRDLTLPFNREF